MIDGGRVGIGGDSRTLLDALETLVITLSGGEDSSQGVAQGIKQNDVRGGDGRHG